LTSILEREQLVMWIDEAVAMGARRWRACAEAELSLRTLQRWVEFPGFTRHLTA
jgi:putative transposase